MISPDAPLFTELYAAFKCTACGCVCEYWDGASFKEKLGLAFRTCPDCSGKLKYTKKALTRQIVGIGFFANIEKYVDLFVWRGSYLTFYV
mgnify:CR=1 FL=1